ncbi:hypothetical protein M378DRAFT_165143 [Amanita muscaria Koide BX008]|uniref:Uncharacterized protein n=1 Tax=Amanita muscaria (strain Koide BX008) TaxID=946122 RepID=A0A0C2X2D4_AMAMK|nr:hypothetical protein M378DRAFT_165143 [Amanita muscaria Koide BX008]
MCAERLTNVGCGECIEVAPYQRVSDLTRRNCVANISADLSSLSTGIQFRNSKGIGLIWKAMVPFNLLFFSP